MKKDTLLGIDGLNQVLMDKLYPKEVAYALNHTLIDLKLLEKGSKGFKTLREYIDASRKV
jgi:hypothetical protein